MIPTVRDVLRSEARAEACGMAEEENNGTDGLHDTTSVVLDRMSRDELPTKRPNSPAATFQA